MGFPAVWLCDPIAFITENVFICSCVTRPDRRGVSFFFEHLFYIYYFTNIYTMHMLYDVA